MPLHANNEFTPAHATWAIGSGKKRKSPRYEAASRLRPAGRLLHDCDRALFGALRVHTFNSFAH